MAKKLYSVYLEYKDYKKLLDKAHEMDYSGRGTLSYFFSYIANNELVFLDANCKRMLKSLNLSSSKN